MITARNAVLKGYKQLILTSRVVFNGDDRAIQHARNEIRAAFKSNMYEKDQAKVDMFIREITLADEFARENLVQAVMGDDGRFHAKIEERHVIGSAKGGLMEDFDGCCKTKN